MMCRARGRRKSARGGILGLVLVVVGVVVRSAFVRLRAGRRPRVVKLCAMCNARD